MEPYGGFSRSGWLWWRHLFRARGKAHFLLFSNAALAVFWLLSKIIDGQTVITGSFNFTKAAEETNAENLLVIQDPSLAAKYLENWKLHADHSDAYQGRGGVVNDQTCQEW
jgi:hypothetical protein